MSIGAPLNRRLTQLAVGRHLPHRTVRVRLTLLYGGLFLLSGAALMAIAYALLVNAGFVFTLQNSNTTEPVTAQPSETVRAGQPLTGPAALPRPGTTTHPSAQTMTHERNVTRCMRRHGVSGFPDPRTSVPSTPFGTSGVIADHDGAIFLIPATINMQAPAFIQAAVACGYLDAEAGKQAAESNRQHNRVEQQLLIQSGIALAGMSLLSLALGWLIAGRVLQPLKDSYEAQRQFVANASHELRAPLARQRALIEVALANSSADVGSLRSSHERVLASEQRLEQLIDGLLTLTRGQAGLERREHLDLSALTSQAVAAREPQLAELDLVVRATLAAAPTSGDPRLIEQLIANLIDNAIRHNISCGHIEITTGMRDRRAFVSISNTGPSIPPEEIQRLLQPFQRLGAARTSHNNGQGLGLSIVQAIATVHSAEFSTRARPEGGLTIEVTFPSAVGVTSGLKDAVAWKKRRRPRAISETDAPAGG